MPYIVMGEPNKGSANLRGVSYDYDYPEGLDLRPGSDLHRELLSKVWERARESRDEISKRFESWRNTDKTLVSYIPLKDWELKQKEKDPNKPVSVVFPYTYSMLEALLSYLTAAFFRSPIFEYEGVEGDDVIGAMLMELVINLHCIKSKVFLNIHTALRDSLAYGIGAAIPGWIRRYGKRIIKSESVIESDFGISKSRDTHMVDALVYEGNDLSNIDPYMFLPDPNVPSSEVQKGEFIGWLEQDNLMNLLSAENEVDSDLFNVKYLKHCLGKRSAFSLDESEREIRSGGSGASYSSTTAPVDVIKMYINLIPKDWGLSDREVPEKWYFELANDSVIISCGPADHMHGLYPIAVSSPEYDGYSVAPMGRIETLHGLQHILDFLFNSHIESVQKAINDMLIVDPYLVNIKDLEDPKPGKLIRLRRPAWGRGVDKVVQQLHINDVTRANIADSAYITGWMDRISGADQSMQGAIRQGGPERLTKAEFSGTRSSAVSRLQRMAMIIGMQFMQDIGEMFAAHTQQYMSEETSIRITGRHSEQLMKAFENPRIKVSPFDLAVNYDLLVRDGSVPGGNFSDAWLDLFKTISSQPELMQRFDVTRIFTYIAQQLGAKNAEDFKRNVQGVNQTVMPDDQVAREAQAGNLVPVSEMGA